MTCRPYRSINWMLVGLCSSLFGILVLSSTTAGAVYWWHRRERLQIASAKAKGPPGQRIHPLLTLLHFSHCSMCSMGHTANWEQHLLQLLRCLPSNQRCRR